MVLRRAVAGVRGLVGDVRTMSAGGDVDLAADAPAWVRGLRIGYEVALVAAAVVSAYLLFSEGSGAAVWTVAIWFWFAVDYSVRLMVANDRIAYVKRHRVELLAALPLDVLRPLRLLRLLRPVGILLRATKGLRDVLGLTGFRLIAAIGLGVVLGGAALFKRLEPESAASYGDAVWWAVVTATTVGYGDISPKSPEGRAVAAALMITGIGLLGALTGEVAQRLTQRARAVELQRTSGDPEVDHVIDRLTDWRALTHHDRRRLVDVLDALAGRDPTTPGTPATPVTITAPEQT